MQRLKREPTDSTPSERYKPLFELGQGGMGVVTLALARGPEGFAKLVVLKRLHAHLLSDPDTVRMFLDEARVSARLSHKNVVQVYEVGVHQGSPVIVMEYLEGQPLSAVLSTPERLPLDVHVALLAQVLQGLSSAHELMDYDGAPLKLVHRDVSPQNVFVGYDGQVKVLDFGIAKVMGSEAQTRTGVLKGKLRYMSPEQAIGEGIDARSDIFGVGVMLWEALAGRRMWKDASEGQVLRSLLQWKAPELDVDGAPTQLVETCQRALAFDPDARHSTAEELRSELQQYLESRSGNAEDELSRFMDRHFAAERAAARKKVADRIKRASSAPPPMASSALEETRREALPPARSRMLALATVGIGCLVALAWMWVRTEPSESPSLQASSSTACAPGTKECSGQCVSVERPDYGCGGESCIPCSLPNATPRCGRDHQCDIAVCYPGFENCDGDPATGCEVDLRTDPNHCGACSAECPEAPQAQVACGDSCRVWRCSPGYEDCNESVDDGCETNIASDGENCGACGVRCDAHQSCREARCAP